VIGISDPPQKKPSGLGNRLPGLMVLLIAITLLSFLSGLLLPQLFALYPPATLHLVLALGIMPLILGAMTYFIPVLTRTGSPETRDLIPPLVGLAAGLLIALSFFLLYRLFPIAAGVGLIAVGWISWWAWQRAKSTLGRPHPGLLWYQLALGMLALGLIAIIIGAFWPEQWLALKRLHLHLNILGFVGLTALGTLRVLLPTVGSFQDPQTGPWLMKEWRWLLAGTLLIALGAAWLPLVSGVGLLLWLIPLIHLGRDLLPHRSSILAWHGAAPSLVAALVGLLTCLLAGGLHGYTDIAPRPTTDAFILAFLLPLVTGAATHLLPMWLHSQSPEKQVPLKNRLGYLSGARGLLFLAAGLLTLVGLPWAFLLGVIALGHFFLKLGGAQLKPPETDLPPPP
jgi:hypothetical protein